MLQEEPPANTEAAPVFRSQPTTESWSAQDPRSSSTQSLVPHQQSEDGNKRWLLLIWIHGFMGNETSFQSFPAHVHNALCQMLQERENSNHVVHTKIYPKYRSRNKIQIARDVFSEWLAPHEDANTDIILLGHSLGGILSAEVALKQGSEEPKRFRHRISGTISFDTPFLGMHPGVISSGISSLFRPAVDAPSPPTPTGSAAGKEMPGSTKEDSSTDLSNNVGRLQVDASQSSLRPTEALSSTSSFSTTSSSHRLDLPIHDPNYDPPYKNDVRQTQRSGWSNLLHFVQKHTDGATLMARSSALSHAVKSYVTSHAEFGRCLADIPGLKVRYKALRDLEDGKGGSRIRFVNYYTASTGRPRRSSPSPRGLATDSQILINEATAAAEKDLRRMQIQATDQDTHLLTPGSSVSEMVPLNAITSDHAADQDLAIEKAEDREDHGNSEASSTIRLSPPLNEDSDEDPAQPIETDNAPIRNGSTDENHYNANPTESNHDVSSAEETADRGSQPATSLPPIPSSPQTPPPFDPSPFSDKNTRKAAEKDHARSLKLHAHALKDRDKAVKARQKFLAKQESSTKKEQAKAASAQSKEQAKLEAKTQKKHKLTKSKEPDHVIAERARLQAEQARMDKEARRLRGEESTPDGNDTDDNDNDEQPSIIPPAHGTPSDPPTPDPPSPSPPPPPKKLAKPRPSDKNFCILPSSSLSPYTDPQRPKGQPDPCWVRVFMEGVDEVGAHCGLFFVDGRRYEWFVEDVARRVEGWVL